MNEIMHTGGAIGVNHLFGIAGQNDTHVWRDGFDAAGELRHDLDVAVIGGADDSNGRTGCRGGIGGGSAVGSAGWVDNIKPGNLQKLS